MKPKAIILLSGGLDSTVSAAIARRRCRPLFALTFDYGQRAARMEIAAARRICRVLKIEHKVVRLPFFADLGGLALLRYGAGSKQAAARLERVPDVWVPNRNGLFVNIAATYAEYHGAGLIVTGFNREEARAFPDNSPAFVAAVNRALRHSTRRRVKVISYVAAQTKREIYRLGQRYGAPLELIYSCYAGGRTMCGKCASCRRLLACRA